MNAGDMLRIVDADRFELVWTTDGWKTTRERAEPRTGQRRIQRGCGDEARAGATIMDIALAGFAPR